MKLFRKQQTDIPYDRETQIPAVRRSICTGEMTVGFVDKATGKFRELYCARSQAELEDFCRRTGVEELKTIY